MADIKNHASLTTSLVSYWDLEEASGTRYDLHGSNDLTDNNTVPNATGIIGNGADFTEANTEYLSITDNASLSNLGDHSWSFWFKANATGNDNAIVGKWETSGREYILRVNASNKFQYIYYSANVGASNTQWTTTSAITDVTAWNHYVVTVDVSAATMVMYVNGSSVAVTQDTSAATSTYDSNSDFTVGMMRTASPSELTDGVIDELGLWTKILTSGEVSDLYNSGAGLPYEAGGGGGSTFTPRAIII